MSKKQVLIVIDTFPNAATINLKNAPLSTRPQFLPPEEDGRSLETKSGMTLKNIMPV
jgi:hypothetical protein